MTRLSNPSEDACYQDYVRCTRETAKALLVVDVDGEEHWVPKSQIHGDSEVEEAGDEGRIAVKRWFAEKEGWPE